MPLSRLGWSVLHPTAAGAVILGRYPAQMVQAGFLFSDWVSLWVWNAKTQIPIREQVGGEEMVLRGALHCGFGLRAECGA